MKYIFESLLINKNKGYNIKIYPKNPCIYTITNKNNNKIYVGSAKNFKERFNKHYLDLLYNRHHSSHLQNSWNKYGAENFIIRVIEETTINNLIEREQYYIDTFESYNQEKGYNMRRLANSSLGIKRSEETRRKMSIAQSKRKHSEETRKKQSLTKLRVFLGNESLKVILIEQYTKNGELIKTWDCGRNQISKILNISSSAISNCLLGRSKTSAGFIWKYKI